MSIEQLFDDQKSGRLLNERRGLLPEDRDFHYLMSEMVEPLIGAVITGGVVIGDGVEDPLIPVLFVEQGGKKFSVIISSDDEVNDGGRILFERGTHMMRASKGVA